LNLKMDILMNDRALPVQTTPHDLGCVFEPRAIAIVGASEDDTRIGGRPLRYLREARFAGQIYPVNPNRATVQGLTAYASVQAIPDAVDLAIVAVPGAAALTALATCEAKGVKAAIVFSAGFAEAGDEGAALQQHMLHIARRSGMRILGPNCLGVFNMHQGFIGTFTQAFQGGFVTPGPVAIASQSGACGGHLAYLCQQRGIGIGYWATTGNEVDVDVAECIHWLATAPGVRVIVAYIEAVRDGQRFIAALEAARRNGRAVVVLKVGRSSAGARAAASHTGALVGQDAVYDAVLKQYGAYRANSMEELLDVTYACAQGLYPSSRSVGIVTVSGGIGVQMADAAEEHDLEVPVMPTAAQAEIKAMLPFAGTQNPIDVTAQSGNDKTLLGRCLDVVIGQSGFGAIVIFLTSAPAHAPFADRLFETVSKVRADHPDRLLVLSFLAPTATARRFEALGCLVFDDPNRAIRSIAALARLGASFARHTRDALTVAGAAGQPAALTSRHVLDEVQAKALLSQWGVGVAQEYVARTPQEIQQAADKIGGPVVLKILSPDIAHKTEVGGVLLDVRTPELAAERGAAMLTRIGTALPDARLNGVLVSRMYAGGTETICGVKCDPTFGPVVMFGLGGIFVEVLKDVAFRVAPFGVDTAMEMVQEIRGKALLYGARGKPPADVDALAQVLSRLSHFAAASQKVLDELDINPLMVMPRGQGAHALDALIVPKVG
jgi:acyl-CoA synthetase (NDP forming)